MNILCVSTAAITTPPAQDGYGGMEREMAWLIRGLNELGHHVDLVGKPGSTADADTIYSCDDEKEYPELISNFIAGYDLIIDFSHDKTIGREWPDKPQINTYQVMTLSHRINPVFISYGQRRHIGIDGPVIYYGIDLAAYPLYEGPREDYFLYVGSLIIEKRPHWVAELAEQAGLRAVIAGPRWQQEYWPVIDQFSQLDHVTVLDEVAGQEKLELIQRARALVHPVGGKGWVEAGAIIVLEALACGTPVICTPNGCLPEYISHNLNGFIGANVPEMLIGASALWSIQPKRCRLGVKNFNYRRMARDYESLATKVIGGERW